MSWPDRGRKRGYWENILLGIDQGAGTWFGIDADESISSYLGRVRPNSFLCKLVDWVFEAVTGEKNHCLKNVEAK